MVMDEDFHGTVDGYNNWLCRCRSCRRAWSKYMREYREKRRASRLVEEDPAPYTPERKRRLPDD